VNDLGNDSDAFYTVGLSWYLITVLLYAIYHVPTIVDQTTTPDLEYLIFGLIFSLLWPLILFFSLFFGVGLQTFGTAMGMTPDIDQVMAGIFQVILVVISFIIVLTLFTLISVPIQVISFFKDKVADRRNRIEILRSQKPLVTISIDDVTIKSYQPEVVISLDLNNSGSVDCDCQILIEGKSLQHISSKKFTLRTGEGIERISLPIKIPHPGIYALKASLTAKNKNNPLIQVSETKDFMLAVDPVEIHLNAGKSTITKNQSLLVFTEIKSVASGTITDLKLLSDKNAVHIVKSPDLPIHFEKGEEISLPFEIKGIKIGKTVVGPAILIMKEYPREIHSSSFEISIKPPVPRIEANLQGRKRVFLGDRLDLHLELENLGQGKAINFQFDTASWRKVGLNTLHTPAIGHLEPGGREVVDLLIQVLKSGTISIVLPIVFQDEGGGEHRLKTAPLTITVEKTKPQLAISIGAPPEVMTSKEFKVDVHIINSGQGHASDVTLSWKSPVEIKMIKKILKIGTMNPREKRSVSVIFYSLKAGSWPLKALLGYRDLEGIEYKQESEPLTITSQDILVNERKPVFTKISTPIEEIRLNQGGFQMNETLTCYYCGFIIDRATTSCPSCQEKVLVCEVCKRPINFDDDVGACIYCDRRFHQSHLMEWVKNKGSCPACKNSLKDDEILMIDKSGKKR